MDLFILIIDLLNGFVDIERSSVQHRILNFELMLMGYLLRQIFVIALGGHDSDLDLLQGKDDSDMRSDDE